jgi:hypothetical protein
MIDYQQKVIFQKDIEMEIRMAEAEKRNVNLSNKTIHELNLSDREIKCGFDFRSSIFLGSVYFGKSVIEGDLILDNAVINNTFYLGEIDLKGSLLASRISVKNSFNLVKSLINGEVNLEKARIQGFLSLNKARVKSNANLKSITTTNLESPGGTVSGDVFFQGTFFERNLDLEFSQISGLVDLENANIWGYLNLSNVKIREILITRDCYIEGESLFENMACEKRIDSMGT